MDERRNAIECWRWIRSHKKSSWIVSPDSDPELTEMERKKIIYSSESFWLEVMGLFAANWNWV